MNAADYHQLLKAAAVRPLTEEEKRGLESWFVKDPAKRVEWEEDLMLEQALARLPAPVLSSNFTSQVLRAVELERQRERLPAGFHWPSWLRSKWSPAFLTLFLAGLLLIQNHRQNVLRAEVARSLSTFVDVAALIQPPLPGDPRAMAPEMPPLPDFRVFTDFDAISRLNLIPEKVDMDLLLALQ